MTFLNTVLKNILDWIDFPTLIATIMGGIIIWKLSESSKKGKLKIFTNEQKILGVYPNDSGGSHETTNLQDPLITHYYLWLDLDIYNSADHVKIGRSLSFRIKYSDNTFTDVKVYRENNLITSLNFEPKVLEQVYFNTTITKAQYSDIKKIILQLIDEKGRNKNYSVTF